MLAPTTVASRHLARDLILFREADDGNVWTYRLDREDAARELRTLRKQGAYIERDGAGYYCDFWEPRPTRYRERPAAEPENDAERNAERAYDRERGIGW